MRLYDDGAFQNDEELVGGRVHVPAILPLEDGKAQAAVVDPIEYLVAVLLRHRRRFLGRSMTCRLGYFTGSLLYSAAVVPLLWWLRYAKV